jgi:hypothetical protein
MGVSELSQHKQTRRNTLLKTEPADKEEGICTPVALRRIEMHILHKHLPTAALHTVRASALAKCGAKPSTSLHSRHQQTSQTVSQSCSCRSQALRS